MKSSFVLLFALLVAIGSILVANGQHEVPKTACVEKTMESVDECMLHCSVDYNKFNHTLFLSEGKCCCYMDENEMTP